MGRGLTGSQPAGIQHKAVWPCIPKQAIDDLPLGRATFPRRRCAIGDHEAIPTIHVQAFEYKYKYILESKLYKHMQFYTGVLQLVIFS